MKHSDIHIFLKKLKKSKWKKSTLLLTMILSEAVVERGLLKLTITNKQTQLDNTSVDALMRMSFNNVTLVPEAVQQIVDIGETTPKKNIFWRYLVYLGVYFN